uniref:Uncharacterized protein n=1 Tax=Arundo donax TaxID=35708 RepID=A0A0A8Z3I8_ARUDO
MSQLAVDSDVTCFA